MFINKKFRLIAALFPSGSATEQTLDVRFRATSNWFYRSADFLVVRDTWGDPQQIMLSQGKWKFTMSASASDLFVVGGRNLTFSHEMVLHSN